jgi:hypothetical protein
VKTGVFLLLYWRSGDMSGDWCLLVTLLEVRRHEWETVIFQLLYWRSGDISGDWCIPVTLLEVRRHEWRLVSSCYFTGGQET